jgi:hypothetical protein
MQIRFRKRVKILPGIYLNLGTKSASLSAGIKGAWLTKQVAGGKATRGTIGLPGSGLSATAKLCDPPASTGRSRSRSRSVLAWLIALSLFVLFSGSLYAQPALCATLTDAIDDRLKTMSLRVAGGLGDDSAPRASVRHQQATADLLTIQINTAQMDRLSCAPVSAPLSETVYIVPALKCVEWRKVGLPKHDDCDATKWARAADFVTPKPNGGR